MRTGMVLRSRTDLRDILDQMQGYEKRNPEMWFVGAITGGKSYQNGRVFYILDEELFLRLVRKDETDLETSV